ncbi:MAG: hypothetical protein ACP5KZ_08340 [bacterium]
MRLRMLLIILLVLVVLAGIVWWRWGKYVFLEAKREKVIAMMTEGHIPPEQMPKPLGNPKAKVVVEIVAPPYACHNRELIQLAKELAEKYPDKLYIKFTASPPIGAAACLGVVINGKQKFQIGERMVELHGPFMPTRVAGASGGYTKEDIESALQQEIKKAYKK